MARGDGIHRTSARNMRLTTPKLKNAQQHNEREKESYVNQDIVPERSPLNIHFKKPDGGYLEKFQQMEASGTVSTRGIKEDAFRYGELIFDVNSVYFFNHGGYDFAKQFYHDAYQAAIKIVGGEQYILSAVMHADERNRAMSEALGQDVYHYHLHVVYVPVVEKQIRWSKRCKDKSLVGKVKETVMQVSMSKKWASKPVLDEATGEPLKTAKGKPVLKKSYSVLQDDFFQYMREAGYVDVERGERGSTEEHLTVRSLRWRENRHGWRNCKQKSRKFRRRSASFRQIRPRLKKQPKKHRWNFGYWLPNSKTWKNWRLSILPIQRSCCRSLIEWSPPNPTGRKSPSRCWRRSSRWYAPFTGLTWMSARNSSCCNANMIWRFRI